MIHLLCLVRVLFILQPNAFLYIGADSGIYRIGSRKGNITTLIRTYSNNANYIYYGKNNQSTGNGIPNVVKSLTVDLYNPTFLLVLKKSISVSETLDLKNGIVKTDTAKLILGINTSNLGNLLRTNGYVFGEFGRYFGNTTNVGISGLMPIGVGNYYRPNSIEFTQAPLLGGLIMSKFYTNDPGSAGLPLTDAGKDILAASYNGFWSIAPANGNFTNGIYTNTLYPNHFSDILDVSALHIVVRNPGNMWTLNGTHITPIGSTSSPIVSRTNMTTFGEFGISFHNTNSTLPVSWNSFNVESINNDAILTWSTNLEINNEYFEIEKSIDAVNFEKIGEVKGAGNSSILNNYNYTDIDAKNSDAKTLYYRIKQIDTDKKYTYTDIKFIELNKTNIQAVNTIQIYPNPSSDFIKINASTEIKYISVVSLQGNIVYQIENFGTNGLIDISNFSNNMYLVNALYTDNSTTTNRIIKN